MLKFIIELAQSNSLNTILLSNSDLGGLIIMPKSLSSDSLQDAFPTILVNLMPISFALRVYLNYLQDRSESLNRNPNLASLVLDRMPRCSQGTAKTPNFYLHLNTSLAFFSNISMIT